MCDYSLENYHSRAARTGDRLITTSFPNFPNSPTRGFSEQGMPEVAVCLLPGTELSFEQPIRSRGIRGLLLQLVKPPSLMARFRQIDLDKAYTHHDAIECDNGRVELLANLRIGQVAVVLQLPVAVSTQTAARKAEAATIELVESPV